MPSRNNEHCTSVRYLCLQLPFVSPFVNVTFSGGLFFRTTAITIPPLSRDVSVPPGPGPAPLLVLSALGSAEEGRCGRKDQGWTGSWAVETEVPTEVGIVLGRKCKLATEDSLLDP